MTKIIEKNERLGNEAIISVILTNNCNLRCKQCSNKKNFEQKMDEDAKADMSVETARKAIGKFWEMFDLENSKRERSILVIGGEPLTNQDALIAIAKHIRNLDKKSGIKTGIFILTNGMLVTAEFARMAKHYEIICAVSLDGSKEIHDKYRKDAYGNGSYDRAIKGLEILSKEDAKPLISTVLTNHSIKDAESIVAITKKFGIKDVMIKPLLGDTINFLEKSADIEQYAKIAVESALQYFAEAEKIGIKKFPISANKESFVQGIFISGNPAIDCSCAMYGEQIAIWPDGTVSLCEKMKDMIIGSLQTPIEELVENKNILVEKLKQRLPPFNKECRDCDFKEICSGGCAFSARCITGDLMKKDPLSCFYSKSLYEILERQQK